MWTELWGGGGSSVRLRRNRSNTDKLFYIHYILEKTGVHKDSARVIYRHLEGL
jgi:hypothetical protein